MSTSCLKCFLNSFCLWLIWFQVLWRLPNVEGQICNPGSFQCVKTGECIPKGWVCDGDADCATPQINDTSDEDISRCNKDNVCPKNYFRCKDGISCRRISKLCDGNHDCPDFSDEGPFCLNKTICATLNCTYGCKPSPKGPLCFCREGKEPNGNECINAPNNTCGNDELCDQICNMKDTSYECSCVEGYKAKGHRCIGINVPYKAPPTLIFTNSANLQHIYMNGSLINSKTIVTVIEKTPMDFIHRNETICWFMKFNHNSGIRCSSAFDFSHHWDYKLPDLFSQSNVNQIAYEWISGNWYFLDDEREMLFVCNKTLEVCISLIDVSLSKPKHIALDPTKGLMFFTEWGYAAPALEKSRLDGSERIKLVVEKIVYPNGITVDIPTETVYWVDMYLGTIEKINYDGTGRKTVIRNAQVKNLYGISVFEDYIYVTSVDGNNILAIQKFNFNSKPIKSNMTHPFSIHVYHRQRQPNVTHPCSIENGHCEHICIPLYKFGAPVAKCRCKAGFKLLARGKKCVAAKQGQILLYCRGHPGAIKGISLEPSGKQEDIMVPILGLNRPIAIDYDARTQFIYYSDVQRYVIERQKIDGTQREVFLEKGLNNCQGLAIDWMGRNLYWTDEGLLAIYVAKLDDSSVKKRLIYDNMAHPKAIVVDPKRGMMYWSDWSTEFQLALGQYGGKIERAHMDGTNRQVFLSINLQWPSGLSIDYSGKKLYWCDAYLHRLERISLDGTNREAKYEIWQFSRIPRQFSRIPRQFIECLKTGCQCVKRLNISHIA
ncbi:prolow-density lipoprotein receptor-related protein 1-like isoform X2 [Stegodyphus dumicola]|uniref:prolow-density lipoprotein receptor-related protein 1-like isoform X2 n=1 Tax=Stegodyphus dumicola TaxID=202533 RepID=UPI0015AF6910|nr:prolow-density lipoprotein receptor-related protein 1-like isoform X2 [Stegodyphus dumicola]